MAKPIINFMLIMSVVTIVIKMIFEKYYSTAGAFILVIDHV